MGNSSAADHYATWPDQTKRLKESSPDVAQAFGGLFAKAMGPGALGVKEKELVALGIGLALRCERCIYSHAEKCVKAGATREAHIEVAGEVVIMQGGPGYVYMPTLIEALDELGV